MYISNDNKYVNLFRLPKRQVTNEFDWGDQDTVGIFLKSIDPKSPQQFGTYLGQYERKFIVSVIGLDGYIVHYEVFNTLQELKAKWECD